MSENKKYYWLKLPKDFFEDRAIKKLRSIAGGDTYTIIYLKMLLRTLEDDGKFVYEGIEDNIIDEIALDIDEKEELILYSAKGCGYWNNSGYIGRVGVYEIMEITKTHKEAIWRHYWRINFSYRYI